MGDVSRAGHIVTAVPNGHDEMRRIATLFGMAVRNAANLYPSAAGPLSGFKIGPSGSPDGKTGFLLLRSRASDSDEAHASSVAGKLASVEASRRAAAEMPTSFLKNTSGLNVRVVADKGQP